jgi:hypothetical protein
VVLGGACVAQQLKEVTETAPPTDIEDLLALMVNNGVATRVLSVEENAASRAWLLAQLGDTAELDRIVRKRASDPTNRGWVAAGSLWPGGGAELTRLLSESSAQFSSPAPPDDTWRSVSGSADDFRAVTVLDVAREMSATLAARGCPAARSRKIVEDFVFGFIASTETFRNLMVLHGRESWFTPDPEVAGFVASYIPGSLQKVAQLYGSDLITGDEDLSLDKALLVTSSGEAAPKLPKAKGFSPASRAVAEDRAPLLRAALDAFDLPSTLREELAQSAAELLRERGRTLAFAAGANSVLVALTSHPLNACGPTRRPTTRRCAHVRVASFFILSCFSSFRSVACLAAHRAVAFMFVQADLARIGAYS